MEWENIGNEIAKLLEEEPTRNTLRSGIKTCVGNLVREVPEKAQSRMVITGLLLTVLTDLASDPNTMFDSPALALQFRSRWEKLARDMNKFKEEKKR